MCQVVTVLPEWMVTQSIAKSSKRDTTAAADKATVARADRDVTGKWFKAELLWPPGPEEH